VTTHRHDLSLTPAFLSGKAFFVSGQHNFLPLKNIPDAGFYAEHFRSALVQ
jgi:hypothetical protein